MTAAQAAAQFDPPASAASSTTAGSIDAATSPAALREVVPDVPLSARRTVRGHIVVGVRVTVGPDGSVSDAVVDRAGPSRYFQRLALDAARQWTFPPVDKPSRRVMQVRFSFGRDGTTANAITIRKLHG
jgi:protein TonB